MMVRLSETRSLCCAALIIGLVLPGLANAEIVLAPSVRDETMPTLAPMIEQVLPSMVSIAVMGTKEVASNPLFNDPFFRKFFNVPEDQTPRQQEFRAVGSGVVIDASKGLVLTNAHLVAEAGSITVILADGRQLAATVMGADTETDIAALTIAANHLTALTVGHSGSLRVGDYVVALGNPFGLEQTVTSGIVSALGRSGLGIEGYENFIQVDAAINPGNSGGALVNLRGELVGINTAIIGPSGGNVGIGLAIPIDMAMKVVDQLVANGRVHRGQIGVVVQNLTPALATAMDLEGRQGVLISDIAQGSPAAAAGMVVGDVILSLDGTAVASAAWLRATLGLVVPGTTVNLVILHDGTEKSVSVTLVERGAHGPNDEPQAEAARGAAALDGVRLRAVDSGGGLDGQDPGVLIDAVDRFSAAATAGLQPGDIISSVNRIDVRTPDDVARAAEKVTSGPLLLRVFRNRNAFFVVIH